MSLLRKRDLPWSQKIDELGELLDKASIDFALPDEDAENEMDVDIRGYLDADQDGSGNCEYRVTHLRDGSFLCGDYNKRLTEKFHSVQQVLSRINELNKAKYPSTTIF
ncbi:MULTISPECIES: hypothetical protein [unclassified Fibrobacter]|uniref:hypothetical protein n=1 Tax=unclassified Fibrobacter TaxID=2634177 RepID=UPI000918A99A|nr:MULTISPECIES: hypothetical protein [unclassified Fibrobacter]OWV08250.1 hypothetical protein B7993_01055 [Fibrobacter sp. UWH3]SHL20410.1 hypothetical protein SAMN05720765_11110 [Fibrobacter sp. UWH6]